MPLPCSARRKSWSGAGESALALLAGAVGILDPFPGLENLVRCPSTTLKGSMHGGRLLAVGGFPGKEQGRSKWVGKAIPE